MKRDMPAPQFSITASKTSLRWVPATSAAMGIARVPRSVQAQISALPASTVELAVHAPVLTVDDVVRALGISPASIVKSLVLETRSGAKVLASVVGDDRLDLRRCEELLGEPITLVPIARLKLATVVPRGALSPLAWDCGTSVLDARLVEAPLLHTGSGINTVSLRTGPSILSGLPGVRFGAIRKERP